MQYPSYEDPVAQYNMSQMTPYAPLGSTVITQIQQPTNPSQTTGQSNGEKSLYTLQDEMNGMFIFFFSPVVIVLGFIFSQLKGINREFSQIDELIADILK
jgi:hypothetical protein